MTFEGLKVEGLHPLQEAFSEKGAVQGPGCEETSQEQERPSSTARAVFARV